MIIMLQHPSPAAYPTQPFIINVHTLKPNIVDVFTNSDCKWLTNIYTIFLTFVIRASYLLFKIGGKKDHLTKRPDGNVGG